MGFNGLAAVSLSYMFYSYVPKRIPAYILCSRPPGSPKDLNKNAWGTIPEPLWSQSQEQSASGNGGLHLSGDFKKRKRKKKKKPEDIIIFTFT